MEICLKLLTEKELELLMNWRMSEDVNKYMTTSPKLTMEGQLKWFEKLKEDNTQIRWIIWAENIPIGSVYLTEIDHNNQRCSGPGWFIVEKQHINLKQTIDLHRNCCGFAFDVLRLNRLYGDIMSENKGVIQLVKLCGFEVEGHLKEHIIKDGIPTDMTLVGLTKDQWEKKNFSYDKIDIEY